MLAFIHNLSISETVVIGVLAVLVFGRNLPEVAGRVFGQLRKMRRAVEDLRRETGIDKDMQRFRSSMRDIEQEANVVDPLRHAQQPAAQDVVREIRERAQADPIPPGDDSSTPGPEAGPEPAPPAQPLGQPMEDPANANAQEPTPEPAPEPADERERSDTGSAEESTPSKS